MALCDGTESWRRATSHGEIKAGWWEEDFWVELRVMGEYNHNQHKMNQLTSWMKWAD